MKESVTVNNSKLYKKKGKFRKKETLHKGEFTIIRDVIAPKKSEVGRILPHWLLNPIAVNNNLNAEQKPPRESCSILSLELIKRLEEEDIKYLFPVQQAVIPEVLAGAHGMETRFRPRDICVATPTGSGKTLSYVLPVVQALKKSTIPAIRCLVIVPVIELAKQVHKVFQFYASCYQLVVGQAFGLEKFLTEQKKLVKKVTDGYQCTVDILVATPGRLTDHIANTPGLEFSQLRFLILDEADKLLTGDGGDVIARIQRFLLKFKEKPQNLGLPPFFSQHNEKESNMDTFGTENIDNLFTSVAIKKDKEENKNGYFALPFADDENDQFLCQPPSIFENNFIPHPSPPIQRLLFSATLSSDPQQLQNIALYRPLLITAVSEDRSQQPLKETISEFVRPSELQEILVKCETNLRPLILHYLLRQERKKNNNFKVLVFASSIELTSKIAILLKALSKGKYIVEEFSSKFNRNRKKKMEEFLSGAINVLVSSDAMARGIDVPDVDCVVSYDVPSAQTYIHRIGRTARGGKPGKAISLLTDDDMKNFKKILKKDFKNLKEEAVPQQKLKKFENKFTLALEVLSNTLKTQKGSGGVNKITKTLKRKKLLNRKK